MNMYKVIGDDPAPAPPGSKFGAVEQARRCRLMRDEAGAAEWERFAQGDGPKPRDLAMFEHELSPAPEMNP